MPRVGALSSRRAGCDAAGWLWRPRSPGVWECLPFDEQQWRTARQADEFWNVTSRPMRRLRRSRRLVRLALCRPAGFTDRSARRELRFSCGTLVFAFSIGRWVYGAPWLPLLSALLLIFPLLVLSNLVSAGMCPQFLHSRFRRRLQRQLDTPEAAPYALAALRALLHPDQSGLDSLRLPALWEVVSWVSPTMWVFSQLSNQSRMVSSVRWWERPWRRFSIPVHVSALLRELLTFPPALTPSGVLALARHCAALEAGSFSPTSPLSLGPRTQVFKVLRTAVQVLAPLEPAQRDLVELMVSDWHASVQDLVAAVTTLLPTAAAPAS